ncbi:D-alanyl-D-alanine carboxypeptidase/D-alanyl-D-alanine-endopeptidase [Halpernia sp.]|uniref:D-alanyl-D-alanine carboxypeptidase/D-alanyl-D-alanine endopeptidase n=1 Tax=Halpernia sp. TaxID=2782209 RepID=UPI003A93E040
MFKLKNLFIFPALSFSIFATAQGTFASNKYTSGNDNFTNVKESFSENKSLAKDEVESEINKMMSDPVLRNANWGFVVYDPITQKIVTSYNETTPLVPASTTKLLTTDTAFGLVGENFKWKTQLEYKGDISEDGTLTGNLYIVGSGDPSLGTRKAGAASYTEIVSDYIRSIADAGIKKIKGDIIIQTAVFKVNKSPVLPENIVWVEDNNYYLPVGTTLDINPRNEKLVVPAKNPFKETERYFYVSPYAHKMVFASAFDGKNYLSTTLPEAPSYLATLLKNSLNKSKLPISGSVINIKIQLKAENREVLYTYESPTLMDIVHYTNQHSDNGLAEAILRMVGFQKFGDQSLSSGKEAVISHLTNINFDLKGLNYIDGSGLSHSNTVTPIAQAKFLASRMKENYFKDYFESLPIAGQSGTLRRMFVNSDANGQIFAKTGTLNKVKALAGYIKTKTGRTLTFSLLVNNYAGSVAQVKQKMELLLTPTLEL